MMKLNNLNILYIFIFSILFFGLIVVKADSPPLLTGIDQNPLKICTIGNFPVILTGLGFIQNSNAICLFQSNPIGVNYSSPVTFINSTNVQCMVPDRIATGLSLQVLLTVSNDGLTFSNGFEIRYSGKYAWDGNVFLTGHDPDFHGLSTPANPNAFGYGRPFLIKSLDYVTKGTWNNLSAPNRKKFLYVESKNAATGSDVKASLPTLIDLGLTLNVHFDHVDGTEFANVALSDYSALVIASAGGGLLTTREIRALNARKQDITYFLKQGGGLAAYAQAIGSFTVTKNLAGITDALVSEAYGFLPITVNGSPNILLPYKATPLGISKFNITTQEINDPSHSIFSQTGGLDILTYDAKNAIVTLAGNINACPDDCNGKGSCTCGECFCGPDSSGPYCECQGSEVCTKCGDHILQGDELCDGGLGCTSSCTCGVGYEATEPLSLACQLLRIPRISTVTTSSTVGDVVTMSGTQFGVDAGAIQVSINGLPCTHPTFTDATKLIFTCTAPPGVGVGLPISVNASGRNGDGQGHPLFNYNPPTFSSIDTTYTEGGLISIKGSNFGQSIPDISITIGNKPCLVSSSAHSYLICNAPSGSGVNLPVSISIANQNTSSTFSYKAPVIDTTTNINTQGGSLTLIGKSFGVLEDSKFIYIDSDLRCENVTMVLDHKIIACDVSSGSGVNHNVKMTVNTQNSNIAPFAYNKPSISHKLPAIETIGRYLTVMGHNFGTNQGLISVLVNGTVATELKLIEPHYQISFFFPPGTGSVPVYMIVDGQNSESLIESYQTAVLDSIDRAPTQGGLIFLNGSNYGNVGVTVTIDGNNCPVVDFTENYIQCEVLPGTGSNKDVVINVNGIIGTFEKNFSYQIPTLLPYSGSSTAGQIVTLTGSNFGNDSSLISLFVAGQECTNLEIITAHSEVSCLTPASSGIELMDITVDGQSSGKASFVYSIPQIDSATPTDTKGGEVTISGSNFGTIDVDVEVTFNDRPCTDAHIIEDHTKLTCNAPSGTGSQIVQITVDELISAASKIFNYSKPTIDSSSPIIPTNGGEITISGHSFGNDASKLIINTNNQPCISPSIIIPNEAISCIAYAGQSTNQPIQITVDSLTSSMTNVLNYQIPRVISVSGSVTAVKEGKVTIQGNNFGTIDSEISVEIDNNVCSNVKILEKHKTISCLLQPGSGFELNVKVTVSQQSSVPNKLFSYDDGAVCDNPKCGGHGTCIGGVCSCNSPYFGPNCDHKVTVPTTTSSTTTSTTGDDNIITPPTKPVITPNTTKPDVVIRLPTNETMNIFVKSIREHNYLGDILRIYPISELKWNLTTSSVDAFLQWNYTIGLENNATVAVSITYFQQDSSVQFAGQNLSMPTGNVKFNIDIDHWDYINGSAINTVNVIMTCQVVGIPNNCNEDQVSLDNNKASDQLHWFEFNQNGMSLYGRFSNRAVTDDRIVPVKQVIDRKSSDGKEIDVAIQVPHFNEYTKIDPDFSILLGTTTVSTDCGGTKSNFKWYIPVAVVGSVAAAGAAVSVFFYRRKKIEENKFKKSLSGIGE